MKTTTDVPVPIYAEIPFAIFAKVPDYSGSKEDKKDFVCLAAVFNETFYKTKRDNIDYKNEVFHTFIENPQERDRW